MSFYSHYIAMFCQKAIALLQNLHDNYFRSIDF